MVSARIPHHHLRNRITMSIEARISAMEQQLAAMLAQQGLGEQHAASFSPEKLRAFVLERTKVHDEELREISLGLCRECGGRLASPLV